MPRYSKKTDKASFMSKLKELMDNDEFPYEMPAKIEEDLKKVDFDFENCTMWDDLTEENSFVGYPCGHMELSDGLHVAFLSAGGDWEFPVCFVLYLAPNNQIRAYIPVDGNAWNKEYKCAYGTEMEKNINFEPTLTDEDFIKQIDKNKIIEDVKNRIKLK